MNPMLEYYHALVNSGHTVHQIQMVRDALIRVHPIAIDFIFDDNRSERMNIMDINETNFKQYDAQLRVKFALDQKSK